MYREGGGAFLQELGETACLVLLKDELRCVLCTNTHSNSCQTFCNMYPTFMLLIVREHRSSCYSDVQVHLEGAYSSSMVVGGWLGQGNLVPHLYILAV